MIFYGSGCWFFGELCIESDRLLLSSLSRMSELMVSFVSDIHFSSSVANDSKDSDGWMVVDFVMFY